MALLKNLLTFINGSIGTNLFRSYYLNGIDILDEGDLSCAFYVSSLLRMVDLIEKPHCTVSGTISDMELSGWYKIRKPKVGCVVVWEPIIQNGSYHKHIGFYIGDNQAVSNRSSLGVPGEHALRYSGLDKENHKQKAKISALYWHDALM